MGELIINDRRGQKKEPRVDPIVSPPPGQPVDKSSWKSTAFVLIFLNSPNGPIPLGRAVGLRSDEELFVADWQMPPMWSEGTDWTKIARQRLDTFLNCQCGNRRICGTHELYIRNWQKADAERLQAMAAEPMPECLERHMMAERAARPSIVVPR